MNKKILLKSIFITIISIIILYYIFIISVIYVTTNFSTNTSFKYAPPSQYINISNKSIIEKNIQVTQKNLKSLNIYLLNKNNTPSENYSSSIMVELLKNNLQACKSSMSVIYINNNLLNSFPCKIKNKGNYELSVKGVNFTNVDSFYLGLVKSDNQVYYNKKILKGNILMGFTFQKNLFSIANIRNSMFLLKIEMSQYKPSFMKNHFIYLIFISYFMVISILIISFIIYLFYNTKQYKIIILKFIILLILLIIIFCI